MEPKSWNINLHPKYSQVLRPEGKADIKGVFSDIVHENFCDCLRWRKWQSNGRRGKQQCQKDVRVQRTSQQGVQEQCWLNEVMETLVLAGQNVIEAQGVTAALHSRDLKRSTYSHLWNCSSLQIRAKKHVITQTAQASAWPLRNICWSEEREAEDIQTWGRSPERESEIIYQSPRWG